MNKQLFKLIKLAQKATKSNEVPVGAFIVYNNKILTKAYNNRRKKYNITGHAEIIVINRACRKRRVRYLSDCDLYVTLKPCKMCQEVIREAKINRVYYLLDPLKEKENRYNTDIIYEKITDNSLLNKYKDILSNFFKNKR